MLLNIPADESRASCSSSLRIWTNKPVSSIFTHQNPLVYELTAQAGNVIMKRLKNSIELVCYTGVQPCAYDYERSCSHNQNGKICAKAKCADSIDEHQITKSVYFISQWIASSYGL
jgi:hypothetical protein